MSSTTPAMQPATPAEAEELAMRAVGEYLNACRMAAGPNEAGMIGNYLMKLVSVASVLMAHAEGSEVAVARLQGTVEFVANKTPRNPSKIVRVQ